MAAPRPSSPDLTDKKYMRFTRNNVQRAVGNVRRTDDLGKWLCVPVRTLKEIESQFRGDGGQEVKKYVDYFMDYDPLASWRRVIVSLDEMGEEAADKIRHLAEAVTDSTLTINNLRTVTSSVRNWYRLGNCLSGLGVPGPVLEEIRDNPAMTTEEDKRTEVLLYFLRNVPMASWERVAGALYWMKEERALQAVKKFLTVSTEPSFTPENLSTVLDIMSDSLWKMFGVYTNIPQSELSRIWGQCTSDRECKQALIHTFLSSHPAPSWTLVEWALYMTDYLGEDDTCLRALYHLQQLFPTARRSTRLIKKPASPVSESLAVSFTTTTTTVSVPSLSVSSSPPPTTSTNTTTTTVVQCSSPSSTTSTHLPVSPPSATTTPIVGGLKEDDSISDRDLAVIARDYLTDWEIPQPFLGLSRAQKKSIANSYPRDYEKQKRECLEVWKEGRGRKATYRALILAAEEARDQLLADNIRDMLKK